jgi:ABC-type glycerol-3-phosphate transport system substrate-binding protein
MRKFLLSLALVALLTAGLSGMRSVRADGEPQYAGLDKDLKGVTIRMANIGGGQYENMYKAIPIFEEKTGAKVDYDVSWNHTSFMAQYTDYLEDLNTYFTKDELKAFSPAIIDSATIGGKLLLIPRHADISALHYRVDLYNDPKIQDAYKKETGSDLKVPATLDDVDKQARFFVKNGYSKYGYGMAGKEEALNGRFYELLFASGGEYQPSTVTSASRSRNCCAVGTRMASSPKIPRTWFGTVTRPTSAMAVWR